MVLFSFIRKHIFLLLFKLGKFWLAVTYYKIYIKGVVDIFLFLWRLLNFILGASKVTWKWCPFRSSFYDLLCRFGACTVWGLLNPHCRVKALLIALTSTQVWLIGTGTVPCPVWICWMACLSQRTLQINTVIWVMLSSFLLCSAFSTSLASLTSLLSL
jgi:hypothetical protein